MRKVALLGMGHVGSTIAFTLVTKGLVDELVLLDRNHDKVQAEYYDLLDTLARIPYTMTLKANDYSELADTDLLITSFGKITANDIGTRFGEYELNTKAAVELGAKIKESGFKGILLNISNPCDVITTLLQRATGLPHERVFGTGTSLDTARMQRAVAQALNQDPKNVAGYVLGEHGDSQFAAWSTVKVANHPVAEVAKEHNLDLAALEDVARKGGYVVHQGKGYTCYAIASCAIKFVVAIFNDGKTAMPTSVYLPELKSYVGYPAVIGRAGIVAVPELKLTPTEAEKLAQSAQFLRQKVANAPIDAAALPEAQD